MKGRNTTMRYTKPACVASVKATQMIQSGTNPNDKPDFTIPDQVPLNSLSAAYEADE